MRDGDNNQGENKLKKFLLKSWHPIPSWQSTIVLFVVLGLVLIGFGVALIIINARIVEVSSWYDAQCTGKISCNVTITVAEKMSPPIFFYYELTNFYQNHRRYLKSRSTTQLSGAITSYSTIDSDCDPLRTNKEMNSSSIRRGKIIQAVDGSLLDPMAIAIPCGLISASFFEDRFQLYDATPLPIPINENGIAWPSDVNTKFKNTNRLDLQWLNMTDEHFMVWMRASGLPDFRKLWGKIEQDVLPGTYTVQISPNSYPTSAFNGKKGFVLSTTGPFGGRNQFIAISYLVVGSICLLLALLFMIRWKQLSKKNQ